MGAIFGVVALDRQPIRRDQLDLMGTSLAAHGPDGGGTWVGDFAGLGSKLMCFTPEDRLERQPLPGAGGHHVLVADCRIDNRPELAEELGISPSEAKGMPDSSFILRAYGKWGLECVIRLSGSYVFALCDLPARRVVLARSPTGRHSLFFHTRPAGQVAFSTAPRGLFALPSIPRELNLQSAARYLAMMPDEPGATLFSNIARLHPGQAAIIERGDLRLWQYWKPTRAREIRFGRDDDYLHAFNSLFARVVADHTRSLTPVGIMMSGGLDSSSIAAIAALQMASTGGRLLAFTEVPAHKSRAGLAEDRYGDETPYVQAMARTYPNIDLSLVRGNGAFFLDGIDGFYDAAEAPYRNALNRSWWEAIHREAHVRGSRVLLTGLRGNLTFSWNGEELLSSMIGAGRWLQAVREAHLSAKARRPVVSTLRVLSGGVLAPWLPVSLEFRLRRLLHSRTPTSARLRDRSALRPEVAKAQKVEEWAAESRAAERSAAVGIRIRALTDRRPVDLSADYARAYETGYGIQTREPADDRRLIEFCLALPEDQYRRDGISRSLVRRAMQGRVPEEILANQQRGEQASDWFDDLLAARDRLGRELTALRSSPLASEMLDLDRMEKLVQRLAYPQEGTPERLISEYQRVLCGGLAMGRYLAWFESGRQTGG